MIEPNILAFQNAELLQAIEDAPLGQWTKRGLAEHLKRDESNLGKTLTRLTSEGILADPPLSGLTDEGRAQLAAFKRARHGGERRKAKGRWPLDKFRRNPSNRRIDPEAVLGLADAIAGVGDILVPLIASMPDDDGIRTIWAGERRWLAATRLAQTDGLPSALLEGLPFNEREADAGEAALITLVENGARSDLTPWEDAKQLRLAADATGLNGTELARRIGRAREGDRGGVRDVQTKLKVAREARPDAIAAYEADPAAPGAWETLRNSVVDRSGNSIVTTKAQRLALAELLHKAGGHSGQAVAILPAGHAGDGQRLVQYGLAILTRAVTGDTAQVTRVGVDYLQAEGLTGGIEYAREKLGFPGGYGIARYRTEWLNTAAATTAPSTRPDPEVAALAGIEPITVSPLIGYTPGQPYPRRFDRHNPATRVRDFVPAFDDALPLSEQIDQGSLEIFTLPHSSAKQAQYANGYPRAQIKIARLAGGDAWIYRAGYSTTAAGHHEDLERVWASQEAFPDRRTALEAGVDLIADSLGSMMRGTLPVDIATWLANPKVASPHVVRGVDHLNAARAGEARRAAGLEKTHANYGSGDSARRAPSQQGVLQEMTRAAMAEGEQPSADTPSLEQPEPEAADADAGKAAETLAQVRAFVAEDGLRQAFGGWRFRQLATPIGLTGPFVSSGSGGSDDPEEAGIVWTCDGSAIATCDPTGEWAVDHAEAQAELVAYALNVAGAMAPSLVPDFAIDWPDEPKDESPDQALARIGNLVLQVLSHNATTVAGSEDVLVEIARQFTRTVRAAEDRLRRAVDSSTQDAA
ncbi:ParB/RepB/Spo0J family partition protein [Brevundimonas subvibrioides]|uniref:ParB domain protein nuclease n=1 Tax=Brevundimonas subvibrioides (strain ATCC 15264 / DSM 4735 / LMG 14903 / NBRC 16000 / CB 81) TaxID=633149 RepID=D9QFV8_BRESC|nr:ParB N-terminal domain-containing protein [Brevundimonas subvibrioides]ADL00672.1 ParB domain protein nuclease [Brevundimonas subvibrioides ATCC 15264]